MADRPGSLPEFEARFPDDTACARWLPEKRWPGGFRCPACGHDKGWELGRGTLLVECVNRPPTPPSSPQHQPTDPCTTLSLCEPYWVQCSDTDRRFRAIEAKPLAHKEISDGFEHQLNAPVH